MFGKKKINRSDQSDEHLADLSAKGDRLAFEIIYERYFAKLVWFAKGFVDDPQQAEDIVQEVFVDIIEKPGRFDSTRKFSTWIYTVTANQCRQHIRNRKNRLRILVENFKTPASLKEDDFCLFDKRQLKEKMSEILSELSEKEKQIYILRFEQELKIKDIAEITDLPEGSVKSGIYYLLKKLAFYLKDFSHGK